MKALISLDTELTRVHEVRDDDDIFDVPNTMMWVDCPDDTDPTTHNYNPDKGEFYLTIFELTEEDKLMRFYIERQHAYGDIGDQLDMIYKEIKEKGFIDNQGDWFNHIDTVKQTIKKEDFIA